MFSQKRNKLFGGGIKTHLPRHIMEKIQNEQNIVQAKQSNDDSIVTKAKAEERKRIKEKLRKKRMERKKRRKSEVVSDIEKQHRKETDMSIKVEKLPQPKKKPAIDEDMMRGGINKSTREKNIKQSQIKENKILNEGRNIPPELIEDYKESLTPKPCEQLLDTLIKGNKKQREKPYKKIPQGVKKRIKKVKEIEDKMEEERIPDEVMSTINGMF